MSYKIHTNCRVCGSANMTQYLDLGLMPLSNNLCTTQDQEPQRYPLKVLFCHKCGLSQLSIVIDPETLFGHYVYRSSISKGYRDHCRQMAIELKERYNFDEDSFHIDIAGNDGALLHEFKQVIGGKVLNVDPAANLAKINEAQDIRMFNVFWSLDAARHLRQTGWQKANLITATNVFAHVDDVKEFLTAVAEVLAPAGVLVLEFPYLVDFIEKGEFDTIYFEHLSYFSITPLHELCKSLKLGIISVEKQEIHGGSVRVTIGHGRTYNEKLEMWLDDELQNGFMNITPYLKFAQRVRESINQFRTGILKLKEEGKRIYAFGASAKGNTLLNSAGITGNDIEFIIDETPEKIGKFSPGTGIEIMSLDILKTYQPDYIVLLAWNFADECIGKCRAAGYKGKFILPLTFQIIE